MAGGSSTQGHDARPGPLGPGNLNRPRIIEAAIAFVDAHNLSALTMRRLGG